MKLALAVWNGRISPVFDHSRHLLVVDVKGGRRVADHEIPLVSEFPPEKVTRLRQLGVHTLICGAVSRPLGAMIAAANIRLIPFTAGDVETVLEAFLAGNLPAPRFLMPGCGRGRRGGRGCGRGRSRGGGRFRGGQGFR